ncbi:MAG: hypothetical protein ACI8T1_001137 [Verrucomicrobiales bacterium]|jgi:hypothetical protein
MRTIIFTSVVFALILTDLSASLQETAARLQSEYGDAVVHVQAVTESRGQEREVESLGTVIDSAGTVVVAHARFTSNDLKDVRFVLADGTEVPAKVALTDPDLDLAFIVPDEEAADGEAFEFTPVSLSMTLVELKAADPVLILSREGEAFRREASILIGHVETVLDTPRRYYRTEVRPSGCPAFDDQGRLVGIFARRVQGDKAHHRVIVPSPAILKSVQNLTIENAGTEVVLDQPDLLKIAAGKLLESYGESIALARIKVEMVISVGEQSQTLEQSLNAPCTVIREDGLSLAPDLTSSIVSQVKSQVSRQTGGAEVNVGVEMKQIKLVLGDGTEIPSKIVFQDRDLNLSFILPDKGSDEAEGVTYIPVTLDDHAELTLFEEVLALSRLGEDLNRDLAVRNGRVSSIIRKPRLIYRTDIVGIGAPVFNINAKIGGFQVPKSGNSANMILPIPAILKSMQQIPAEEEDAVDDDEDETKEEDPLEEKL